MAERSKRRSNILWILIAIVILVPLALCGGVGVWWVGRNAVAQAKLDEQIAALEAKGMPVDDRTMAEFHARLSDDLYTPKWLEVIQVTDSEVFNEAAKGFPIMGTEEQIPAADQPWGQQAEVAKFLDTYSSTLATIHEVAIHDTPVRFPVQFNSFNTLLENTQAMRSVARLLVLEHEIAVREGDASREYQAIQSLLGCAIAVRGEPTFVSSLVSIAIHGIAAGRIQYSVRWGNLSEEQLANISKRLNIFDDYKTLTLNAVAGERAMALPVFQNPAQLDETGPLGNFGARPIDALSYLRVMERYEQAIGEQDINGFLTETDALDAQMSEQLESSNPLVRLDNLLTALVFPAMNAAATAVTRSLMLNRLAKTGIAVRIFRLRNDRFPENVQELESLPFDLVAHGGLDGKPFGYKKTDNGAVLWGFDFAGSPSLRPGQSVPSEPPGLEPGDYNEMWVWEFRK